MLLREHSRLKRLSINGALQNEARYARNQCYSNFWNFAKKLFDDGKGLSEVFPGFSQHQAEEFFKSLYSSEPHHFTRPTWMPPVTRPKVPLHSLHPITSDELIAVLRRARNTSAPSPFDQISYRVFKNCPSGIHLQF